jgi:hypothetical protein
MFKESIRKEEREKQKKTRKKTRKTENQRKKARNRMKRRNRKNEKKIPPCTIPVIDIIENVCIHMLNVFEKLMDFHVELFPT